MARPLLLHTYVSDSIWVEALIALESGAISDAELASRLGVSPRTLGRRLERAQQVRADQGFGPAEADLADEDSVSLELVAESSPRGMGGWYDLRDDSTSHDEDGGWVWVNDGRGRPRLRHLRHGDERKDLDDGKAEPTSYNPDPNVKGGLGSKPTKP